LFKSLNFAVAHAGRFVSKNFSGFDKFCNIFVQIVLLLTGKSWAWQVCVKVWHGIWQHDMSDRTDSGECGIHFCNFSLVHNQQKSTPWLHSADSSVYFDKSLDSADSSVYFDKSLDSADSSVYFDKSLDSADSSVYIEMSNVDSGFKFHLVGQLSWALTLNFEKLYFICTPYKNVSRNTAYEYKYLLE
jgi:hypothetical protein